MPDCAATGAFVAAGTIDGSGDVDDPIGRLTRPSMKAPLTTAANTTNFTRPNLVMGRVLVELSRLVDSGEI